MSWKSLETQYVFYGSYHTNHVNVLIHIVCVPLIFLSALTMLFSSHFTVLPYAVLGAYCGYFTLLEPVAGLSYSAILTTASYALQQLSVSSPSMTFNAALSVFVVSWLAQFYGHFAHEGRAPALFTSLLQSLVLAVFFVYLEVLFSFGYNPKLHSKLQQGINKAVAEHKKQKKVNAMSVQ